VTAPAAGADKKKSDGAASPFGRSYVEVQILIKAIVKWA